MKKWNCDALTALKGDLKLKVKLGNGLIDKLETAAGGFMSQGEAQMVESMPNNAAQVGKVIEILEGKSDTAFWIFCRMLRESNYGVWANELEKKAKELKGDSGTHVLGTFRGECLEEYICMQRTMYCERIVATLDHGCVFAYTLYRHCA